VASTIIGATTLAQLEENIAALNLQLAPEVVARIDAIHASLPNPGQ
jgi:aryl-alcohol dehydrogenase-like predicted oxidoreductase